MMVMHIAYGLDMIALALGAALLVWSMKNPGKGSWLGKLIGALIVIFSIISIVCMISCAMKGGQCRGPMMHGGEGMMGSPMSGEEGAAMKKGDHKKS